MLCTCYAAAQTRNILRTMNVLRTRARGARRGPWYHSYAATRVAGHIAVGLPAVRNRITMRSVSRYITRMAIVIARMAGRYLPHEGDCDPAPLGR